VRGHAVVVVGSAFAVGLAMVVAIDVRGTYVEAAVSPPALLNADAVALPLAA
jgi:hypothetical protein